MQPLKFRPSKNLIIVAIAVVLVILAIILFTSLPLAEVAVVQRGTAISAVYGTVRIEPTLVLPVRAQNSGFIQLGEALSAGRGAIGRNVEKGELLATIADEATARLLKQARADLEAARLRAELPLPSSEALKVAQDNLGRLEKLSGLSNVPQVEFEKAKSEVNRLKALVETERIERQTNQRIQNMHAIENAKLESPRDPKVVPLYESRADVKNNSGKIIVGFDNQDAFGGFHLSRCFLRHKKKSRARM